ncbi:hypothetical protein ACU635_43785 [[Actinomadura] parvosata]|uniref:hypothetical protein n=1 Tax=[Actinomadura] parvosata TaxID=1955412 RepID=UPI00406D4868
MTSTTAAAVLGKELSRPDPTPRRLLRALRTAGFEVRPAARGPAWMPTTPQACSLVQQAADWHNKGLRDRYTIAERMGRNKRSIDRYLAAADMLGLLDPDAGEPPE